MLKFVKYDILLIYDEICKNMTSQSLYLSWPFDKKKCIFPRIFYENQKKKTCKRKKSRFSIITFTLAAIRCTFFFANLYHLVAIIITHDRLGEMIIFSYTYIISIFLNKKINKKKSCFKVRVHYSIIFSRFNGNRT